MNSVFDRDFALAHVALLLQGNTFFKGWTDLATPPLKQGTIVRAWFTPQRGVRKYRTAAVYTPDSRLVNAIHVDVVMISASCYPDDPDYIPLPFHPQGKVGTRLCKPSSIALDETDTIPISEVEPTWGFVPAAERAEMLAGLKLRGKL